MEQQWPLEATETLLLSPHLPGDVGKHLAEVLAISYREMAEVVGSQVADAKRLSGMAKAP